MIATSKCRALNNSRGEPEKRERPLWLRLVVAWLSVTALLCVAALVLHGCMMNVNVVVYGDGNCTHAAQSKVVTTTNPSLSLPLVGGLVP